MYLHIYIYILPWPRFSLVHFSLHEFDARVENYSSSACICYPALREISAMQSRPGIVTYVVLLISFLVIDAWEELFIVKEAIWSQVPVFHLKLNF
jgi:hypothetical protein